MNNVAGTAVAIVPARYHPKPPPVAEDTWRVAPAMSAGASGPATNVNALRVLSRELTIGVAAAKDARAATAEIMEYFIFVIW